MSIANIPEIINDFNVYKSGSKLIGVSNEVTLPDFEAMTETISGAGIAGEYETTNPGHFSSIEMEVPFRVLYGDIFQMLDTTKIIDLTMRGSVQVTDGTGTKSHVGMRVAVRGSTKKISGGSLKAGSPMSSSVTLEVTYIKIENNGKTALELDKLNGVFVVNGKDIMSAIRSLC